MCSENYTDISLSISLCVTFGLVQLCWGLAKQLFACGAHLSEELVFMAL